MCPDAEHMSTLRNLAFLILQLSAAECVCFAVCWLLRDTAAHVAHHSLLVVPKYHTLASTSANAVVTNLV